MLRIIIDRDLDKGEYIITFRERNFSQREVLHMEYTSPEQLAKCISNCLIHWGDWVEDAVIKAIEEGKTNGSNIP